MLPRSLSAACHMAGSKPRFAPFLVVFFSCFLRAMPSPTPVRSDGLSCAMIFTSGYLSRNVLGLGADLRPAGEDGGGQAAAGSECASDHAPFGLDGGDGGAQHFGD